MTEQPTTYPSSRWPWPGEHSPEAVANARKIVRGLVSGKRPDHRPMSEAEIIRVSDPERFRHEEMMQKIDGLITAVMGLPPQVLQEPERPRRKPYQPPAPRGGPVEL